MQAGIFKGRAIKDIPLQWGDAGTGTLQLNIPLEVRDKDGNYVCRGSTFLPFTDKAAEFSFDKLRALGWTGKTAADLANMASIYEKECDVEIRQESYQGKTSWKLEILSGGGIVKFDKPVDTATAVARVAAMLGQQAPAGGGGKPAPF